MVSKPKGLPCPRFKLKLTKSFSRGQSSRSVQGQPIERANMDRAGGTVYCFLMPSKVD